MYCTVQYSTVAAYRYRKKDTGGEPGHTRDTHGMCAHRYLGAEVLKNSRFGIGGFFLTTLTGYGYPQAASIFVTS